MINVDFIMCFFAGALGGALSHLFWLIKIGQLPASIPLRDSAHVRHRNFMFALSMLAGAIAGFLVFYWYSNELSFSLVELNKVTVIAAVAGLSGESVLGVLHKYARV